VAVAWTAAEAWATARTEEGARAPAASEGERAADLVPASVVKVVEAEAETVVEMVSGETEVAMARGLGEVEVEN